MRKHSEPDPDYQIHCPERRGQNIENQRAADMGPYLIQFWTNEIINDHRVYKYFAVTAVATRLPYMNAAARVWEEMGKSAGSVGRRLVRRVSLLLTYGVPFSN